MPQEKKSAVGHEKKRIVLFDLGGEEVTYEPETEVNDKGETLPGVEHYVFRTAAMHEHMRNVFFGSFPSERHHMVAATVAASAEFAAKKAVSVADMVRLAELDPFAAYSIACAEWVAIPRVIKKKATWRKVVKERRVGNTTQKYTAWQLTTNLRLEVTAFQFENGRWVNKGSVDAGAGLSGLASSIAMTGDSVNKLVASNGKQAGEAFGGISASPDLSCRVALVDDVKEIADGFGQCGRATLTVTERAKGALQKNPLNDFEPSEEDSSKNEDEDESAEGDDDEAVGEDDSVESTTDDESSDEEASDAEAADTEASGAEGDDEANEPPPVLGEMERAALNVATHGDPRRAVGSLLTEPSAKYAPGVSETVEATRDMVSSCKAGVETVVKASEKLRALASNPVGQVKDAALGFAGCAGIPLTYDLGEATPPGTAQRRSSYCKDVVDDVSAGANAMQSVALCEGRVASELSTLMVQKDVINTWWKVTVPLLACEGETKSREYCLAVGKVEGLKRGHMLVAKSADDRRLGFGYIRRQGAGGGRGEADELSRFRFRSGDAPVGTSMEERAKLGLVLGLRPQYNMILLKKDLDSTSLIGGALAGGYNASQFVPIGDEFWVRANIGAVAGQEEELIVSFEALPEAQYYLFSRVAFFVQSGAAISMISKTVSTAAGDEDLSGFGFFFMLGFGLDVALHPDFNFRVAATGSQGLNNVELSNEEETLSLDAGIITSGQGTASFLYSF